jgi:hypothetical protein
MLQKYLPVFVVFLFVILGCASTETIESTKVSASEIYQSYVIESNKNKTNVTATFRIGGHTGTTIDLDAPAKVEHNGKPLNESGEGFFKGTDYQFSGAFTENHRFAYTDSNGKVWQNEISLSPLEMTSKDIIISKSGSGVINLSRPVGEDESVDFSIYSEKHSMSNSNSGNNVSEFDYQSSLRVDLDPSRTMAKVRNLSLQKFVIGKARISLIVRKNKGVQHSAKSGAMDITYQSQDAAANVVD